MSVHKVGPANDSEPVLQVALALGDDGDDPVAVDDNNPVPVKVMSGGSVRESFQLAQNNTPSAQATVFGGDYIFSQTSGAYGSVKLQILGPDGTTWSDLITKTGADTNGGSGLSLGSYAVVRVTLSGTTNCAAILSRVPA